MNNYDSGTDPDVLFAPILLCSNNLLSKAQQSKVNLAPQDPKCSELPSWPQGSRKRSGSLAWSGLRRLCGFSKTDQVWYLRILPYRHRTNLSKWQLGDCKSKFWQVGWSAQHNGFFVQPRHTQLSSEHRCANWRKFKWSSNNGKTLKWTQKINLD
jgi:hypothetical protein